MEEITNKKMLTNQEICIKNVKKIESYLFVELSNHRKFISNGTIVQEFSEYEDFIKVIEVEKKHFLVMKKNYFENEIINFQTKEILLNYLGEYACFKIGDTILQIGNRLFRTTTRKYIPSTENLTPSTFCVLCDNFFLFETKETMSKKEYILVNEKGDIVHNFKKIFPENFDNHIILREKELLRIIPFQNGNLDFENEKKIAGDNNLLHYLEGLIYQIEGHVLYVMDINLVRIDKIELPPFDYIDYSEIEFGNLKICINKENKDSTLVINIKTRKLIETQTLGILPYGIQGPIKNCTIALDNFHYSEKKEEIYSVKLYDENLELLFETENIIDYDPHLNKKENKIWFKKKNSGIIYDIEKKSSKNVNYEIIYFQRNDNNNEEEYGFGITFHNKKFQIFDEDFNLLIENVPYEILNIIPMYKKFSYRYLNGYLLIITSETMDEDNQSNKTSIIDYYGNILYNEYHTKASAVGHYFQIQEKDKTIYFDTNTGIFSTKTLNLNNNSFLIEDKNNFTIDKNGELKLIQNLKKDN